MLISRTRLALVEKMRTLFVPRDFIFHDGRELRRFSVAARTQAVAAGVASVALCFAAYGVGHAAFGAVMASGIVGVAETPEARLARMQAEVLRMQQDVRNVKAMAQAHAVRVEARQRMLAAVLSGKGDPDALATDAARPGPTVGQRTSAVTREVLEPLRRVEAQQADFAARARQTTDARFVRTARELNRLGLHPSRFVQGAMGGPFEPVNGEPAAGTTEADADAQFRSLFLSWKRLDTLEQTVIAVPSMRPVANLTLTSNFGVRTDPFRGTAAMHAGVDIPGPVGTPIYATADGVIGRAGRYGGYGNLVEINHGKGIETRYGHLSRILVEPNTRVRRGQLIGLMGSTGRSTGSHLHYEVRIDGRAVNPMPFLQSTDYLATIQDRALRAE